MAAAAAEQPAAPLLWAVEGLRRAGLGSSAQEAAEALLSATPGAEPQAVAARSAFDLVAAGARLACLGLAEFQAPEQQRSGCERLLETGAAGLALAAKAGDAESLAEEEGKATVEEVARWIYLGLAGASLAGEAGAKPCHASDALPAGAVADRQAFLLLSLCRGLRARASGPKFAEAALGAFARAREDLQQQPGPGAAAGCCDVPWLLRQCAVCHLVLGGASRARACAQESAERESPDSRGHAAARRLEFRALCLELDFGASGNEGAAKPCAPNDATGVAAAAMMEVEGKRRETAAHAAAAAAAFAAHSTTSAEEALGAAQELAQRGLLEATLALVGALRGRARQCAGGAVVTGTQNDVAAETFLSRFEAFVRARHAEVLALGAGAQGGKEWMSALPTSSQLAGVSAEFKEHLAMRLWNFARRALQAERADVAVACCDRLRELESLPPSMRSMSALALCHWCLGNHSVAMKWAETGFEFEPSDARAVAVMLLCHASANGSGEVTKPRNLIIKSMSFSAFAAVLRTAASLKALPGVWFLENIASGMWSALVQGPAAGDAADEAVNAFMQFAGFSLSKANLQDHNPGGVMRALDALSIVVSQQPIGHQHAQNAASQRRCARAIFELLWNTGLELGRAARWFFCAVAFERAHGVLVTLAQAANGAAGGDAGGFSLSASEEAQMCLVARMAALLEAGHRARLGHGQTKDGGDVPVAQLYQSVLQAGVLARAAAGRVRELRFAASQGAGAAPAVDKALPLVVLMEFEARTCVSDAGLAEFVAQVAVQANLPPRYYLTMAQVAMGAGVRDVGMQCLQMFLRTVADAALASGARAAGPAPGEGMDKFAMALRELVTLHNSREQSVGCFEEALSLLRQVPWAARSYPQRELQWLGAVAWSNGAHQFKAGQFGWAQRWAGLAISFADLCPPLAGHRSQMVDAYAACGQYLHAGP